MTKDVFENDNVIIKWFDENMTLSDLDDFIDKNKSKFITKENQVKLDKIDKIIKDRTDEYVKNPIKKYKNIYISHEELGYEPEFEVVQFFQDRPSQLIGAAADAEGNAIYIKYEDTPPNPKKITRVRLARCINFIEVMYNTLRKVNYAIRQDFKEDIVSETLLYFMNRWDKYEYNPYTIATAIQKYKANHIDTYRKDKKQINVTPNEIESYLPKNLEHVEGLQLKELEKKETFTKMRDALTQLDEKAREILMLVADGKSEKEIMMILNIPRGTVASRKSKSIKKLAEILKL